MANLSVSEIVEIIKKPKRRDQIDKAIKHENKLKLHCDTIVDISDFGTPQTDFLDWVKAILPSDKFERFKHLLQPPFPTLELTESIFSELSRIFEGQNKFFKFEFLNPDYAEDFSDYRIKLNDTNFWKTTGFETLQVGVNSFVVVDFPPEQTTPLPEPYYYILDIDKVHDVDYDRNDDVKYFIIRQGLTNYLWIDSTCYLKIDIDNPSLNEEIPHYWGYTPVKDFWKTRRSKNNKVDKKGPITKSLGELTWLLFFEISKKYLDLYAPYPIYSKYQDKCNNVNEFGNQCENGKIRVHEGFVDCDRCKGVGSIKLGVGSLIEVPPPMQGEHDLRNPVQVLPAEINSLEYCRSEIKRLQEEIFFNCVGSGGEPNNDQAKNEKQIRSGFESKINVLTKVKTNFEIINKWTLDTIAIGRYGESFINSTVNYGDISYLDSIESLNKDYSEAQKNGKPIFELSSMRERIYNTENKNNSDEKLRTDIKKALEPWQSLDLERIKSLGLDRQFPEKFILKVNFDEYIQRFEREQTNILMFAESLSFDKKIDRIKEVLLTYVAEELITLPSSFTGEENEATKRSAAQAIEEPIVKTRNGGGGLTENEKNQIRGLYKSGMSQGRLSSQFNVSQSTISDVINN